LTSASMFIVADDHPLFRGAIRSALLMASPQSIVEEAGSFEDATKLLSENPEADMVLLDLNMPGSSGLSGLISLRATQPAIPVVVISAIDDSLTIRRALDLGASGYVSKSASMEEIREAISTVMAGGISTPRNFTPESESDPEVADLIPRIQSLTPQQKRVLAMLAEGLLNKQIAYELSVSEATIKAHVSAILQKLNVDSRTQAVIRLSRLKSETAAGSLRSN
jgi:DNA-binding NarL/FixJ family response regulator